MVTIKLRLGLFILLLPLMALAKPSESEFRQEILAHRHRVLENGVLIANNFRAEIPALARMEPGEREALVRYYLSFHDEPKSMELSDLKKLGFAMSQPIYRELHAIYGLNVLAKQPSSIAELNRIEEKLKVEKLDFYLKNATAEDFEVLLKELQWIEKISDITDTKIYRGEELGFSAEKFSAEKYFKMFKDFKASRISRWLEKNYHTKNSQCRVIFSQ